jgi:ABC-2 type transport system permease protein
MSVQAPALAVGISIVWDRQMGVLRQMLVAPVRRWSVIAGLCLGGTTTGGVYGLLVLAVAGFAGIPYRWTLLIVLLEVLLVSLAFTALGMLAAVSIRSVETFQVVVNLFMMPLMFLSGAMFPPTGLPGWLGYAVNANPLTYAVDAMRRTLAVGDVLGSGSTSPSLWGWTPPVVMEVGLLALVAFAAAAWSARRFSRAE